MKKFLRFLVPFLLAAAIIASCGWYLFIYDRDFTRDTLLSQARFHDLHGNSRLSSWFYNLAYDFSGRDENVAIELANQYKADGNYTKAEYTLTNAINNGGTVELYTALCKTYVEKDKLLDAVNMLANITNPEIKAQLDAMRPSAPTADYESGYYSQYIDVTLTSSGGTLYCTTDGEYPSIANEPYSGPISLDVGETMIYAISVDDNGLVSPVTILGYTITGVVEPAIFMDKTMEDAIRETLGVSGSTILYTNDLWEIREFTVPAGVNSYEDLALMPYLESLTINNQDMDSLAALSGFVRLETLDLTGCTFPAEDLSILADMTTLTKLVLKNCSLSTIAALEGTPNLVYLDLSSNTVRNLEALHDMTTLRELYLPHNALTTLTELSGLSNLEILDVSYNSLTSLSPISSCLKLTALNADSNQLTNVNGIESLPLLDTLSVDYNKLTSVTTMSKCTELVNLSFANNEVSDISSLSTLLKLDVLDFAYNSVSELPDWQEGCTLRVIDGSYNALTSIDNLATLEQIGYIYMDYNNLTSVLALADCYRLVQVNVYGNDIDTVSALTAHNIIVNYDPT